MMKYACEYKCLHCGEKYNIKIAMDIDRTGAFFVFNNISVSEKVQIHECTDGSIGLAQFCGVVKVGDDL